MNFYFPESGVSLIILQNFEGVPNDLKKTFELHTKVLAVMREALAGKQ